jgi:hypothetical protein
VQIETAIGGQSEDGGRENVAVGYHDDDVRLPHREFI